MLNLIAFILCFVDYLYFSALLDGMPNIGNRQDIVLINLFPVVTIGKCQGQDPEVDQILPVNPGKGFGNNRL